jgi:hypothetical protein
MEASLSDVAAWCTPRRLQLNIDKAEAIWFGSRANMSRLNSSHKSITLGTEIISAISAVRDHDVVHDSELSMKQHIAKSSSCYFT